jgi:hypothetical protein
MLLVRHIQRRPIRVTDKAEQKVLQAIYMWLLAHGGESPLLDSLDRDLNRLTDKPIDTIGILDRLSPRFIKPLSHFHGRPDPRGRVVLRLEGVARCQASDDDTRRFLAAVNWMIRKNKGYDPAPEKIGCGMPISAEQLASELELPLRSDPDSIKRLMALLEAEGLISDDEYA